ncbi:CRISPR-associated protein Cst1 [Chitinophaga terrae (ex Kim and Jung 2007)]|uniref:type I-B CRISPR-associated protein Cas8b1/Cst1 n=1 Tax=Chitinophaga terrae (ex Kim and Jung 2007) TaxID=408074 RepID=UPI00278B4CFE|nr:type I-B CRISPR-associated protein Cas8b1/Cst1 [Chitinophaga terrae (ex Kim and Jung 2007)]MDQ0109938.1 CRISPR-associated protein Cst1 [Chitinophaga terrae (ex Kim and Jung 2007)]
MRFEKNWLTSYTGDPFADAGGFVIKQLWQDEQFKDKSILELIKYVTKVYVNNWGAKLHSFFLNSKITQAAFVGDRKIEEAIKYYTALLNDDLPYKEGYCRISGEKTKLYLAGRDNHVLSGSGTYINFHPNFEPGLYLSKEMLIRMFFLPLGVVQLSDKIALLACNIPDIAEYFVKENLEKNLLEIRSDISQGVLKSPFNFPANAIFSFIDHYLREIKQLTDYREEEIEEKTNASITLFHFTNFGASPDASIYSLDSKVFQFYAACQFKFPKVWNQFLRSNYRNYKLKGSIFDVDTETWKSKDEQLDYDAYKTWRNEVLDNLMNGESILPNIVKWLVDHPFPSEITDYYLNYIRNMDKKTIQIVRKIADFISNGSEDEIAKDIKRLRGHRSAYELRTFTVGLLDKNYKAEAQDPLFTLNEYADYLFPDGGFWRETKNLLLVGIYENLHKQGKKVDTPAQDDSEEIALDTENNN